MFHCNGWCFPWTVAMLAGTHVCLRRVEAKAILDAIREHGVDALLRRADRARPADQRAPPRCAPGITHKGAGMVAGARRRPR
jgi:fatty-acyl-CoA synthase